MTSTGSPYIAVLKYRSAFTSERLMQPLVTFEEPCTPMVSGLAWMNSPLLEIRTAKRSRTLQYPAAGLVM